MTCFVTDLLWRVLSLTCCDVFPRSPCCGMFFHTDMGLSLFVVCFVVNLLQRVFHQLLAVCFFIFLVF